jgi:hypothetical protein
MSDEVEDPMTEDSTVPAGPAVEVPQRPAEVPEKFWDSGTGTLRTEALLKSYAELERKLGAAGQDGGEPCEPSRERMLELLGRPPAPEDYVIEAPHAAVASDPEVNARLHAAGFTQEQAQLVYELAAERLLPVVAEVAAELEAQRHVDRLQRHFGGPQAWQAIARQIRTWAESHLSPQVYRTLAGSHDGVLALHQMMRVSEPKLLDGGGSAGELNRGALDEMVRDPRYWRQRDPEFIARVTEGFRKLYGG